MTLRIDMKSAVFGCVLTVSVCLLAGVGGDGSANPLGRFHVECGSDTAYLVDTATGQVWRSYDNGFARPKLSERPAAATAGEEKYLGQWRSHDSDEDDLGLRLEAGGRAYASEGDTKHYEGMWRVEGDHIVIMIEDEHLLGEIDSDGRLSLWQKDKEKERKSFQRVQ